MTKIFYLSKEIINNKINDTTKFDVEAQIIKKNLELTINYCENIPQGHFCQIHFNGRNSVEITRWISGEYKNHLVIKNKKMTINNYVTLAGTIQLKTWGDDISLNRLKDGSVVLKFIYDLFQNHDLINRHKVYLQIKG